jgi:hypothetical protein
MRRGTQDVVTWEGKKGEFLGICCGWDFTAEHEWGIKGLYRNFGIPFENKKLFGVDRRKVSKTPPQLVLCDVGDTRYLISRDRVSETCADKPGPNEESELRIYRGEEAGAWDENSWAFATNDAETKEHLQQLYQALLDKDALIFLGGRSGIIGNSGLNIIIASRLPKEQAQQLREGDEDHYKLQEAAEKTKIKDGLKKAGRAFFALSPAWLKNGRESKYPVQFWLNPQDQRNYNAGWYTVEELEEWIEEKGPICADK